MPRIHNVVEEKSTIKIGADQDLPEQIAAVYRLALDAVSRVNELEVDVADLNDALIDLGGPAFRQRLGSGR